MVLNVIWLSFFFLGILFALGQLVFAGNAGVFGEMVTASFNMAKTAFEISIGLTGMLAFFLGLMKVGEAGGAVQLLSRLVRPLLVRIFPSVPPDHPAFGAIVMNIAANMLGLDNAATPAGLKAMKELQTLNPNPDTATDAQILFMVLSASGLTLVPVSIMAFRAQMGAENPADIFLPLLIATFCSTMAALLATCAVQKIKVFQPVVLGWIGGLSLLIFGGLHVMGQLPPETMRTVSGAIGNGALVLLIGAFLGLAVAKKVPVYETFVAGAKEGFQVAVTIIPYLVAMLVGVAFFRASGAMDVVVGAVRDAVSALGFRAEWVDALPTALMKPLSGSGARGMMVDAMQSHGADSFVGRLSCIFQGAADTTLYVVAVYFGSVGVRKTRGAVGLGLFADFVGAVAAVILAYAFFA